MNDIQLFSKFDESTPFWKSDCWYNPKTGETILLSPHYTTHAWAGVAWRNANIGPNDTAQKSMGFIYELMFNEGFVRIVRGTVECDIEGNVDACQKTVRKLFSKGIIDQWKTLKSSIYSGFCVVIALTSNTSHPLVSDIRGTVFNLMTEKDLKRLEIFAKF